MKYLYSVFIFSLALFNISLYAQNDHLPKTVKDYISNKVRLAKKTGGVNKISTSNKTLEILKGNLTNDNNEDIVISIDVTDGTETDIYSYKVYLAVFLFDGNIYKLFAEKEFQTSEDRPGNLSSFNLKEIKNKEILAKTCWWG
jgi:hypothetical protein